MASSPWVFICPSSRGIGFALTRRLLLTTSLPILATTRSSSLGSAKSALLQGLGDASTPGLAQRLNLVRCDVADESSIRAASQTAAHLFPPQTHHLQLGCAIPGVLHVQKSPSQIDAAAALDSFRINALGPLLLAKHFFPLLPRRAAAHPHASALDALPAQAVWLTMAARVGSTSDNRAGGWYSYRASKAAVISLARSLDIHLQARSPDSAMAVAYHPGTVKTDLSRDFWNSVPDHQLFTPEYAAERMTQVIASLQDNQRGRCWDWKGDEVPP
ncbi:hypothetical protein CDD82_1640 [Ophiocordyceps australis]|uniref:Uncharacterized protein n=1 Tax=Ophiocordyceps australis TaxID=1399860 RepID=A0A2C5YFG1_9HYPO|nr:hypothetical protein CDD82_1640 [Ophiocordyceps australis]